MRMRAHTHTQTPARAHTHTHTHTEAEDGKTRGAVIHTLRVVLALLLHVSLPHATAGPMQGNGHHITIPAPHWDRRIAHLWGKSWGHSGNYFPDHVRVRRPRRRDSRSFPAHARGCHSVHSSEPSTPNPRAALGGRAAVQAEAARIRVARPAVHAPSRVIHGGGSGGSGAARR